jgi:hypothetical protein
VTLNFQEDTPGTSPPGIDGNLEQTFFNAAKGHHDRKMRELELGALGRWLGGERNSPIHIAFICIIAGIAFALIFLMIGAIQPSLLSTFDGYFEKDLSFIGMVLAYIFGRSGKGPEN